MSLGTIVLLLMTAFYFWKSWSLWTGKKLWSQILTIDLAAGDFQAQIRLESPNQIRRIVLIFDDSIGFYHGTIEANANSQSFCLFELPMRPERSLIGGWNLDVTRSTTELVYRFKEALLLQNLNINFALRPNVSNTRMIAKMRSRMHVEPTRCTVEVVLKA
jgi:hypothetical protein